MRLFLDAAFAAALLVGVPAAAQVVTISVGIGDSQRDTGVGLVHRGSFFTVEAELLALANYDSGTLTTPNGMVVPLSINGAGDRAFFQTGWYDDLPSLDADFGDGAYQLSVGSGGLLTTYGFSYFAPPVADQSTVSLKGQLDGIDASEVNDVYFDGFTPPEGAEGLTYFSITDAGSGTYAVAAFGLPPFVDGVTFGGLSAGTAYDFELIYSTTIRQDGENGGPTVFSYFDSRTFGSFSTAGAVPEPAAWALMIVGFGLVGELARRRGAMGGALTV